MELEILPEKELWSRAVSDTGTGFILTDPGGRVLMANRSAHTMLGCDSPLNGSSLSDAVPDAKAMLSSGSNRQGRFILEVGSEERIIEFNSEFLREDFVFILLRDVTRSADFEKRILDLEQLSTAEKMTRKFSHEIRDPLAVIFAGLQLLETSSELNQTDTETLRFVLQAVRSVVSLVNKFSDSLLSIQGAPSWIDVTEFVSKCVEHFNVAASSKGILLRTVGGPKTSILAYEPAMTRAISNIIRNALEACKPGDIITIGHRTLDRREVSSLLPGYSGNVMAIFIEDTGPGLPADLSVSSVFRPFVTTKKKNMGLGLSVARDIIEYHGGVISFSSWISGATLLEVMLPLADRSECRKVTKPAHARECCFCEMQTEAHFQFCWAIRGRDHRAKTGSWLHDCLKCEYFRSHNLPLYFEGTSERNLQVNGRDSAHCR